MIRLISILTIWLFSVHAGAACWLTTETDQDGDLLAYVGTRLPSQMKSLCRCPDGVRHGGHIKPEVARFNMDGVEVSRRAWAPGIQMIRSEAFFERVVCSKDQAAIDADLASRQAARQQRAAAESKKRNLMQEFKTHCPDNYGTLWANNKAKWHKCNAFVWKAWSKLWESLNKSEFK